MWKIKGSGPGEVRSLKSPVYLSTCAVLSIVYYSKITLNSGENCPGCEQERKNSIKNESSLGLFFIWMLMFADQRFL